MRAAAIVLFSAILFAQPAEEKDALAAVQKLFDAMKAHDGAAIRAATLPNARFYAFRDAGEPVSTAVEDFSSRIGSMQEDLIERFTAPPKLLIHGKIAQVWGDYEFLRDGKFDHCGIDSVSLFKTAGGWKIASIAYTSETSGCKGHK